MTGIRPYPNHPGRWLSDHRPDPNFSSYEVAHIDKLSKDQVTVDISPYRCVQELCPRDHHYPWRVMVTCVFLNQTIGRQIRPMVDRFWTIIDRPEAILLIEKTDANELRELLKPLGLINRRLGMLYRMTSDYLSGKPWAKCYGIGQYGVDALALFVEGRTDVNPSNEWLRSYLKWRLAGGPPVSWNNGR